MSATPPQAEGLTHHSPDTVVGVSGWAPNGQAVGLQQTTSIQVRECVPGFLTGTVK